MCIVLFSYKNTPGYRLILAANRDEFLNRQTAPLAYWEDNSEILAGRDLERGGTWLGITASGKFGVLTNYREAGGRIPSKVSRGEILTHFFAGNGDCQEYLSHLSSNEHHYQGFNLLIGSGDALYYYSNRKGIPIELQPGIYGLSNHLLDTDWPKIERGKGLFRDVVTRGGALVDELFTVLGDREQPADEFLPNTGVGLEWERILSSIFITSPTYGTRSSAVVLIDNEGNTEFQERTYEHDDIELKTARQRCFTIMTSAC